MVFSAGERGQLRPVRGQRLEMGSMVEVEPDVVLYVYQTTKLMRAQFIRVTDSGLEPLRR